MRTRSPIVYALAAAVIALAASLALLVHQGRPSPAGVGSTSPQPAGGSRDVEAVQAFLKASQSWYEVRHKGLLRNISSSAFLSIKIINSSILYMNNKNYYYVILQYYINGNLLSWTGPLRLPDYYVEIEPAAPGATFTGGRSSFFLVYSSNGPLLANITHFDVAFEICSTGLVVQFYNYSRFAVLTIDYAPPGGACSINYAYIALEPAGRG